MSFTPAIPIVPFARWTDFTPTIPEFYWDVYSSEERIKKICMEMHKLCEYANMLCDNLNIDRGLIEELQTTFEQFKNGEFDEFYKEQILVWIYRNMEYIISQAVKMVFFGLTLDGYFCAYIPDSWSDIEFDTIVDYNSPDYGKLILKY